MLAIRLGLCSLVLALGAVGGPAVAEATEPSSLTALVDAAAVRLQTADPVAAYKWLAQGTIEDPARVDQVLAAVTTDADEAGVDAAYVRQVFSNQIDATEGVEYARFSEWKLNPAAAPTTAPDLSTSRSAIDALNQTMVDEIASHWQLLRSPDCAAERDEAIAAVTAARQLDVLYQGALESATRSYCQL